MPAPSPELLAQYTALTAGAGFSDWGARTQLEFTGADRASFLHNLCTNEVKKLPVGSACEAFITNVQGRTIGHGYILCRAESLIFDTVPGQGDRLLAHFEKYHIREKVEIHDRSSEWGELLFAGPQAAAMLVSLGSSVSIDHVDLVGRDSHLILVAAADLPQLTETLRLAGAVDCSPEAVEMARLEAGTPLFGQDITEANLPQEVGRDSRAISFTKGCYLGQETVARIDALGHVNQQLVGLKFSSDIAPAAGTELSSDDKVVGHVTSASWSPRLSAPLALGYVRRAFASPGNMLQSASGEAQVVSLPVK